MHLKVGELARRTGLTGRTLHHYDEIGLLQPSARSDAGYRLYSSDDVARLHGIQALRHLGIGLKEIRGLLGGDPLVLGTVLAIIGVPRAVFILVGGAVVDRYSPKRVMMLTKYANTLMLALLAALVLSGSVSLWAVHALAFGIGLATAFSIPSGTAMLPSVVAPQQLQAANGIMMGLRQLTMFVGPLVAGVMIAVFGDGAGTADATGACCSCRWARSPPPGKGLRCCWSSACWAVSSRWRCSPGSSSGSTHRCWAGR